MRKFILSSVILLFILGTLSACGAVKETIHLKDPQKMTEKVQAKKDSHSTTGDKAADKGKQPTDVTLEKKVIPLPKKVIIDAPLVSQLPELPNGCEVTSLTMLLQQAGVKIDKMTLAKQMKTVPFEVNGVYGDPNEGFVGNMYHGPPGFAVYHGPVADLAKKYLSNRVVDLTGSKWSVVEQQLAAHHAVWVIVNSAFEWLPPEYFQTWHTKNGDMQVTMHEHSVLVTGYDAEKVYFNDPLTGIKNNSVNKEDFTEAWEQMGSQAISYND